MTLNLIRILLALPCLGLLNSCQTRLDAPFVDDGAFVTMQPRFSQDVISWRPDLTDAQRYVPVHSADGGPGAGGVSLDLDGVSAANRMGISGTVGTQWIRFVVGTDLRFNPSSDDDRDIADFDDDGDIEFENGNMRDIERQPLASNFDSYGYAMMETGDYSITPYIGLELEFADIIVMSLEAGMPRTTFRFEKGHLRGGIKEATEWDVWEGYGRSLGATVGTRLLDNRGFLGLQYNAERYEADVSGISTDIDAHVIGLIFALRF